MARRPAAIVAFPLVGVTALLAGCASAPPPAGGSTVELVMAHDTPAPQGMIVFPGGGYESVVRFDLPPGAHRLRRVRLQAAAPGTLKLTLYASTALESPGEALHSVTRNVASAEVSDGKDGRWLVDDLGSLPSREGTVWVGVKKVGGDPKLWATGLVSEDRAFMRNTDPGNAMGLMPVKRGPMLRLELGP